MFGFFLREQAIRWDLLVAAPWLTGDLYDSLEKITVPLRTAIGPAGLTTMSRVVIVAKGDPFYDAIRYGPQLEHGCEAVAPGGYGAVEIARGYVITNTTGRRRRRRRRTVAAAS